MEQRIKNLILKRIMTNKGDLSEAVDLKEQGFTSLMFVELILFLEEEFGIEIPDEDLTPGQFSSIWKIAVYLRSHMTQNKSREDLENGTR